MGISLLLLGCVPPEPAPDCTRFLMHGRIDLAWESELDVLFVLDDSPSMAEEMPWIPDLVVGTVRGLHTGDRDGDGAPEVHPFDSIHVGFTTTSNGDATSCPIPPGFVLTDTGVGCTPTFTGFADVGRDAAPATFSDLGCVANRPLDGCGLEGPLERATWIVPAGFQRGSIPFAMVFITDEDDCSIVDHVDTTSREPIDGCVGLDLMPISELVRRLRYFTIYSPMHVSLVAGIPPGTEGDAPEVLLDDPRLSMRLEGPELVPSCEGALGRATPPRRFLELLGPDQLGAYVTSELHSVCAPPTSALESIGDSVTDLESRCLPRPILGVDDCDVDLLLAADEPRSCADLGLPFLEMVSAGEATRERCRVPVLPPEEIGVGRGWGHDTDPADVAEVCGSVERSLLRFSGVFDARGELSYTCTAPPPAGAPGAECI